MAAISRIQVANFLTEGYITGKEWSPLYRGETFRLFGQPTAMQIDNGGGKTSLTEACLYLLTQNRRLKPRVEDRVAPMDCGWTHIRIEFIEKPHDEDILQAALITLDPVEMPGIPYVVGMCWSRTKEPNFYSYQGSLDDAPCYIQEPKGLSLVANDSFRKSVERMPGAKWNRWRNQIEWLDEIKQFTNIEVLLQNVEFQLEGAGDYSAMISKVKQGTNEPYDAAFFRLFVAPELLKHAMGVEGDQDEQGFEDTILKTLKPAADALLDINRRQQELDDTKQAIQKFEPVLEKAGEVVKAITDYGIELNLLARNAAVVHLLAVADPLPGMPIMPAGTQWASDKRVMAALAHMAIDKKIGVVITDEGLGALIGVETRRLNERGGELKLTSGLMDGQTIELGADLKKSVASNDAEDHPQPVENKADLKQTARGGRRYGTRLYGLDESLALVAAAAKFTGARTTGLADVLTRAFGIATDEIDTNPYRARLLKLAVNLTTQNARLDKARADTKNLQEENERLLSQGRDAKENQVAYESFAARKTEFPEDHWKSPLSALAWAQTAATDVERDRTEHIQRSSERQAGYALWQKLTEAYGLTSLPDALDALVRQYQDAARNDDEARQKLKQAKTKLHEKLGELGIEKGKLTGAEKRLSKLSGLADSMQIFREIFGDADPSSLNPQGDVMSLQSALSKNQSLLENAYAKKQELTELQPKARVFHGLFGDMDPGSLNPSKELQNHLQAIAVEDGVVTEHQPLIEALTYFLEQHPGTTPDEWLAKTSEQRQALNEERVRNHSKIADFNGELEDLTTFGAADDRVYSKALKLLGENNIAFDRLHDLASSTVTGDRLKQCLTLFSASLSAPVIESLEKAGEAARLLEEAKLTVPIFHKPALAGYFRDGAIHQAGEVAHERWVGRLTRQAAILLNPSLVEEEESRINGQIKTLTQRREDIKKLLANVSEESTAVKTAIGAKEAIHRNSERIHADAVSKRDTLQEKTKEFERRASPDAQEAISAMKRFLKAGGETRYKELAEEVVPKLQEDGNRITGRLNELVKQTTEQALRALHAAKDFQREGGEAAFAKCQAETEVLRKIVESLDSIMDDLQQQVDGGLNDAANSASEALKKISKNYGTDVRDLRDAILFEREGFVTFMEGSPSRMQVLNECLKTAQARLQNIDFDRAERYIQSTCTEERSLSDLIAENQGKRVSAEQAEGKASGEVARIQSEIAFMTPFMEAMHEMVIAIRTQHAKVSMFSEDIRRVMQTSCISDPDILIYAEIIRIACLGELPGIDPDIRSAMLNLSQCVSELGINASTLQRIGEDRTRLSREYTQRRDDFCNRARRGEIKGLNQLEIATIANAKTIEELRLIQETRDKIENQLREIESNLGKIRETMEANKKASISSLASFARQATLSLGIMDRVMRHTPKARFHVEAPVADEGQIKRIIEGLLGQIRNVSMDLRHRQD